MLKNALYLRLSLADGDLGKNNKDESNSIENQRTLLVNFLQDRDDLADEYIEYVDDGYTGTNFERPEFKRMIEDAKAGKIDTIIVKDFSRFGRDYLEVGFYIEYIFPLLQIRLANRLLFRNICRISKQVLSRLHLVTFLITGLWEESL